MPRQVEAYIRDTSLLLCPAPRTELLHVLMLPTTSTVDRSARTVGPHPHFAELLIDCEEDRTLRAVLVGMLREAERIGPS